LVATLQVHGATCLSDIDSKAVAGHYSRVHEDVNVPTRIRALISACPSLLEALDFCASWRGKHALVCLNSLLNLIVFALYANAGPSHYKYSRGYALILGILVLSIHGACNSARCFYTKSYVVGGSKKNST